MARFLYIFPHPDDESFGPGPAIVRQRREGHEVYLLTLTRGEATRQRERLGLTQDEIGDVRFREMQCVARALDLTDLTILDFPDGGLAHLDPLPIEEALAEHIERVRPHIVVTYAVHGNSGHPDHLTTHALVKHVYCVLRARAVSYLRRLAFFTLPEHDETGRPEHLKGSPDAEIGCVVTFGDGDRQRAAAALACHETYRDIIEEHRPLDTVAEGVCFVLFGEMHDEQLDDLAARIEV